MDQIRLILGAIAGLAAGNNDGLTALQMAVRMGETELVEGLAGHFGRPYGPTLAEICEALRLASIGHHVEIMEIMLDARGWDGRTIVLSVQEMKRQH